jgi:hypothetical protein
MECLLDAGHDAVKQRSDGPMQAHEFTPRRMKIEWMQ